MPYLVLAAGLLLSIIGIAAIVTGYPIIQVERGWATVISGSTLLASGVMTMALGLVLRALMGLSQRLAPSLATSAAVPHVEPAARLEPAAFAAVPTVAAAALVQPDAFAEPLERGTHQHPAEVAHEPALAAAGLPPAEAELPPLPIEIAPQMQPAADDYELQTPSTVAHDLDEHHAPALEPPSGMPAAVAEPRTPEPAAGAPLSDDWLDRAFSQLDLDMANHDAPRPGELEPEASRAHAGAALPPPEPALVEHDEFVGSTAHEPPYHEAPHEEPPHEPALHQPEPPELAPQELAPNELAPHEPAPHEPSPSAPPPTAPILPEPAVIGRYESEGTSYVMYADGSIEAQSEAGIYRFASMADLKAFIEG